MAALDAVLTPTAADARAWNALRGHRWYSYRACAPNPDVPGMAAGDDRVPDTVWVVGDGETQKQRLDRETAAIALCARCPILAECRAYALGDTGGDPEPWDIWGGLTAHARTELLKERRREAAQAQAEPEPIPATELDLVVLRALARHRTPEAVAKAAGMTVTRANWHRARLVTMLALNPRTATRMRVVYRGRLAGLLDPAAPYVPDGGGIAAIPSRQRSVDLARGIQLLLPEDKPAPAEPQTPTAGVVTLPTPVTSMEMAA